ncbi:DNA-binding transcriptional regulator, MarR family [Aquimarina amphilecti]|uniref:DNA-binding transcriptional regulator, MarR family n=1 Tax=Aquimarina amphilecti TaxID=1038014 RepID=A0A1H7HER2_AQUAM|nr:MarR family winged helix-turn-helix transcriptional regulator [Aquimarina amphilecti]SEK47922.1 DNA-binding transcriptional regulator, MarR family [Aquimarina amphilecti]
MKYDFQECIGSRLRQMSRVVDNIFRSYLSDFDITENQMTILFALSKLEKVEQGTIGQVLSLERSTVSRNIKILYAKGYIEKSMDYRPLISLTEEGKVLVKNLIPVWEEIMNQLSEKLGDAGLNNLKELENKIM